MYPLSQYRTDLESHVVDAATTTEAVGFITLMQELKRKMRSWEHQVEVFRAGEKILDRQRFQFPSSWVYVDNVEGEWGAFNEIVKRKESSVQTQIGTLQMQIVAEDRSVEQKTTELLQLWEKDKPVQVRGASLTHTNSLSNTVFYGMPLSPPVQRNSLQTCSLYMPLCYIQGELRPDNAANLLTIFEGKFTRLKEDRDNVIKAKEALELAEPGETSFVVVYIAFFQKGRENTLYLSSLLNFYLPHLQVLSPVVMSVW